VTQRTIQVVRVHETDAISMPRSTTVGEWSSNHDNSGAARCRHRSLRRLNMTFDLIRAGSVEGMNAGGLIQGDRE